MYTNNLSVVWMAFSCTLILGGVLSSPSFTRRQQSGCHNTNVLLDCNYFASINSPKKTDLRWSVKDNESNRWTTIAVIRRGNRKLPSNSNFDDRLTLHTNGSLEIKSLKPEDAGHYKCNVNQHRQRDTHVIELSVTCNGKVTVTRQEVCVEDDVLLDCQAKHRTNPLHLSRVMWHKNEGSYWSLVLASDRKNTSLDGTTLHSNGSLLLPAGRQESEMKYKCDAIKNISSPRERHIVVLKSVKCHREKQAIIATIKTTKGRAAMTTSTPILETTAATETTPSEKAAMTTSKPIQGTTVAMETTSSEHSTQSPTTKSHVCGGSLTSVSGGFQSPNFPSSYPANSYCKWTISVPQDYAAIDITLDNMNLEHEQNCQNDYIAMTDELGNQVGCRQCGSYNKPITFQVRGRVAVIAFSSDSTVHKTGFKLTYKATM